MLAAYDPENNLSMISLNDRLHLIEYLRFPLTMDIENASQGFRTVSTSETIIEGFKSLGIIGSARTLSCFCYHSDVKALWKISSKIRREDKEVEVSVPTDDHDSNVEEHDDGPRESIVIQAIVAEIGERMGLKIWLPRSDRSRVLQKWQPEEGSLIEVLPLNYGDIAMKTIENIDVLWIKKRTIVRAFEVEHTTSIYSGLLRMADLLALLPNIDINLHIVAPSSRRDKVFEEIRRPVFSLLEGGALSEKCTYISYDNLQELSSERNLEFLKNEVLDKYSEAAE